MSCICCRKATPRCCARPICSCAKLENLLQSINDEQTQTLPQDELNRARLAWGMHTDDWETLSAQLANHMANVRRVFNELIGDDEAQSPDEQLAEYWRELWQDALEEDDASPALAHLNDADRRSVLALIADFRKELDRRTIGPRGRQVLDQLMPHLLSEICSRADAPLPLARITPLLTGIVTRTTYLELLSEFPGALKHLITLCAASPMVASQLARHPLLLDELLDPNTLYQPTATDAYRDELRQYLLRVPEEDEEQQLEALRQFKQAQQLHIAAADIAGTLAGDEGQRSFNLACRSDPRCGGAAGMGADGGSLRPADPSARSPGARLRRRRLR